MIGRGGRVEGEISERGGHPLIFVWSVLKVLQSRPSERGGHPLILFFYPVDTHFIVSWPKLNLILMYLLHSFEAFPFYRDF